MVLSRDGFCRPAEDEDCVKSEVCKLMGWCRRLMGGARQPRMRSRAQSHVSKSAGAPC